MYSQSENIGTILRKLFVISFFMFMPMLFVGLNSEKESLTGTYTVIDRVTPPDHSIAMIPAGFSGIDHRLIPVLSAIIQSANQGRLITVHAAVITETSCDLCRKRYGHIKSVLFAMHFHPIRSSCENGDTPLIS